MQRYGTPPRNRALQVAAHGRSAEKARNHKRQHEGLRARAHDRRRHGNGEEAAEDNAPAPLAARTPGPIEYV